MRIPKALQKTGQMTEWTLGVTVGGFFVCLFVLFLLKQKSPVAQDGLENGILRRMNILSAGITGSGHYTWDFACFGGLLFCFLSRGLTT